MKSIILAFAVLSCISVFGQSSNYKISPVEAGTAKLINGKTTIVMEDTASVNRNGANTYYVQLTPIGDCGLLKLSKKGNKSFTVTMSGPGADNGTFDYIVFLKYQLIKLNPNLPPLKIIPKAPLTGK